MSVLSPIPSESPFNMNTRPPPMTMTIKIVNQPAYSDKPPNAPVQTSKTAWLYSKVTWLLPVALSIGRIKVA